MLIKHINNIITDLSLRKLVCDQPDKRCHHVYFSIDLKYSFHNAVNTL